ncbi:MAG: hypothetical protein AVDCRST_MAG37-24, partial [uncultured Rubrobacteraceae bacterium]
GPEQALTERPRSRGRGAGGSAAGTLEHSRHGTSASRAARPAGRRGP